MHNFQMYWCNFSLIEQLVFYIVIGYREYIWKGFSVYNVNDVNLHLKTFVLMKNVSHEHTRKAEQSTIFTIAEF